MSDTCWPAKAESGRSGIDRAAGSRGPQVFGAGRKVPRVGEGPRGDPSHHHEKRGHIPAACNDRFDSVTSPRDPERDGVPEDLGRS